MTTTEHITSALDALIADDEAHHLEVSYDAHGSVCGVATVDDDGDEIAFYPVDHLDDEVRTQAEALDAPDKGEYAVVYPSDTGAGS